MKTTIGDRLAVVKARHKKVEQVKAWKASWTRRLSIMLLTYAVVVTYLTIINNDKPFINAAVPPLGFLLSTLVLKQIRNLW